MSRLDKSNGDRISRSELRTELQQATSDLQHWALFALALVSLHIVQFVLLQAPWTERDNDLIPNRVRSGWELVGSQVSGGSRVVVSIVVLLLSIVATFEALRRRKPWIFAVVAGLSIVRIVTVALAVAAANATNDDQFTRFGVALTMWVLAVTVIVAISAASDLDE